MKILMACLMIVAAVGAFIKNFLVKKKLEKSYSWPEADGEITKSKIALKDGRVDFDSANKTFKAEITYKYNVGRRKFKNDKICIGGQFQLSLRGKAEDYCKKYPVGQEVKVHYNPNNPSESVLELREETSALYVFIGLFFAVIGFLFFTNSHL